MEGQTPFRPADLDAAVGLDDRPLELTRSVTAQDHHLGPLDAPAQLVEYGDYQCPFCAEALPGVKDILARYDNRVLFVFRHFPLVSQHPRAWKAAVAAEAAASQGRFWPMHDHLLTHQHELTDEELWTHARALGLEMSAYERDLHDPHLAQRIREDALSGLHSGVLGTPTFFVNGRRLEGGFRPDELETAVDRAILGQPGPVVSEPAPSGPDRPPPPPEVGEIRGKALPPARWGRWPGGPEGADLKSNPRVSRKPMTATTEQS
jgi:protein-disulfide isomerase